MIRLSLLCLCCFAFSLSRAQIGEMGLNVFLPSVYRLETGLNKLPWDDRYQYTDNSYFKIRKNWQTTWFNGHYCGLFYRYSKGHAVFRTELNLFLQTFRFGTGHYLYVNWKGDTTEENTIFNMSNGYLTYLTVKTPVWLGYTFNPKSKLKITAFAGAGADWLQGSGWRMMNPYIGDDQINVLGDVRASMKKVRPWLQAGVELKHYGKTLQMSLVRNDQVLFNLGGADFRNPYMLSATLSFTYRRGGIYHRFLKLFVPR